MSFRAVLPCLLPNLPLWDQARHLRRRGCGYVFRLTHRAAGPIPLAARGLAAVLARPRPGGRAVIDANPGSAEGLTRPRKDLTTAQDAQPNAASLRRRRTPAGPDALLHWICGVVVRSRGYGEQDQPR